MPETHVKFGALESGERSTDPNQPDCGSPKVFGTIETSEAKREKGNVKGLTNQNAPDSNVVGDGGKHSSNSSNPTGNDLSNDKRYGTSDVSSFADFPKGNDANSSQAFPALPAFKVFTYNHCCCSCLYQTNTFCFWYFIFLKNVFILGVILGVLESYSNRPKLLELLVSVIINCSKFLFRFFFFEDCRGVSNKFWLSPDGCKYLTRNFSWRSTSI